MAAPAFYAPNTLKDLGFACPVDANTIIDLIGPNVPISPATSTDLKKLKHTPVIDASDHTIRLIIETTEHEKTKTEHEKTKTELLETRYDLRVVMDELDNAHGDLDNANDLIGGLTKRYRILETHFAETQISLEEIQKALAESQKVHHVLEAKSDMKERGLQAQIHELEAQLLESTQLPLMQYASARSNVAFSAKSGASCDPEADTKIFGLQCKVQDLETEVRKLQKQIRDKDMSTKQMEEDFRKQLQAAALSNHTPNHGTVNATYMAEIARLKQEMASMGIANQKKVGDLEEELKARTEMYEKHIHELKATHAVDVERLENERNTAVYANAKLLMEMQRYDVSIERLVAVTSPSPTPSAASLSDDEKEAGMDIKPVAQTLVQTPTKALSGTFTPVPPTTPPPAGAAVGGMSLRSGTIAGGGGVATAPSIVTLPVTGNGGEKKEKKFPSRHASYYIACKPADLEEAKGGNWTGKVHTHRCATFGNKSVEFCKVTWRWILGANGIELTPDEDPFLYTWEDIMKLPDVRVSVCGNCMTSVNSLDSKTEPLSDEKVDARNAKMGFNK